MDEEFSDFQGAVKERNEILSAAIQCAAYVLHRSREFPLDQRRGMIERVKLLISIDDIGQ